MKMYNIGKLFIENKIKNGQRFVRISECEYDYDIEGEYHREEIVMTNGNLFREFFNKRNEFVTIFSIFPDELKKDGNDKRIYELI